jgi:ADP-ribose pyrophosphatase YjhB (NUDIX family)
MDNQTPIPNWLAWTQQLQAIAQAGLHYANSPYDVERYSQLQRIAVEMAAAHTDATSEQIAGLFQQQTGHPTPKVDVRSVIFRDEKILLVQEINDGYRWTLPGGWVDVGESPSVAAVRETREESGFETRATKLLACYDRDHPRHQHTPHSFHIYKLFFRCEITGGAARGSIETAGVDFFGEDELPELSLGRVTVPLIKRFFEHLRAPDLPTDFD